MLIRTLVSSVLFVTASLAFADNGGTIRDVSLDNLKAKCKELTANPQLKPVKVKISCNEVSQFWQEAQPTQGLLKNYRKVGAQVQMKGYQVPHTFFPAPIDNAAVPCAQYVKMERTVSNVDVTVSCPELVDIDDLGTFCAPIVEDRASEDPGIVSVKSTGESLGFCPDVR